MAGKIDPQTWGWVKLIAGVIAFWLAWQTYPTNQLALPVLILAALPILGGAMLAWGKR